MGVRPCVSFHHQLHRYVTVSTADQFLLGVESRMRGPVFVSLSHGED